MAQIEELLLLASEPLGPKVETMPDLVRGWSLGPQLLRMLKQRNGFYAFESALHVFPLTRDPAAGLEAWNADSLWRNEYRELAEGLLFFAEDILQDQFCLAKKEKGVFRFFAETGQTKLMAESLEQWAERILADYRVETGSPLAHEWQLKNGPLPRGQRLMPRIPFFMGGEYKLENLWAGNALDGMRLKGDLAMQTRDLPSGSRVRLNVGPQPDSRPKH